MVDVNRVREAFPERERLNRDLVILEPHVPRNRCASKAFKREGTEPTRCTRAGGDYSSDVTAVGKSQKWLKTYNPNGSRAALKYSRRFGVRIWHA